MGIKKKTPEKEVQDAVIAYLDFKGWMVQRNQQGLGCTPGRPDLQAIKKWFGIGITIYIECKSPKGKLSEAQRAYLEKLEDQGAEVIVCRTFEWFKNALDNTEYRIRERMTGGNL